MKSNSRTKKSLLNMQVNLICYFISLIVNFFARNVFLKQLGDEFVGLATTFQSLLGFLNIAEMGIAAAIGYLLYKPIYDNDKKQINELISVFGYIYRIIGFGVLIAGFILSLFLTRLYPDTDIPVAVLYFGFYSYLLSSILTYFVNYKQTLFSADQRNYEIMGYYKTITAGKVIAQMILVLVVNSFVLYFLMEFVFGVIYSIILVFRVKKVYPWLDTDISSGKILMKSYPQVGEKVGQVFAHKLGGFFQFQLLPILIYKFVSLPVVALYTNYTTITMALNSMMSSIVTSTTAGVGSLIAEGNKSKIYNTFKRLLAVDFLFASIFSTCIYKFSSGFVECWLGSEYVLGEVVVLLIAIQFFLALFRDCVGQFIAGYGLFGDIWAPFAEVGVLLLSSLILGAQYGLKGVLLGPITSMFIVIHIWKPYYLFSRGFGLPFYQYWLLIAIHLGINIFSFSLSSNIIDVLMSYVHFSNEWIVWFVNASIFFILMSALSVSITAIIFKDFRSLFLMIIKKIFKR